MVYSIREALREQQRAGIKKRQEELDNAQSELDNYLESEQYQRDVWEAGQDAWEQKAKKEGWAYTRKPFISAADRQRMVQQTKEQEIAYLQEKLAALKGDV